MYFSKIALRKDVKVEELAQLLRGDDYHFHQQLWRLFSSKNSQRDFIYREQSFDKWPCFYTISSRQPKDSQGLWEIQVKDFAPKLVVGQQLAFSLRANPVRTKDRFDEKGQRRSVRHDVVMDAKWGYDKTNRPPSAELMQQAGWEWLQARMVKQGFQVQPNQLRVDGYQQHRFIKQGQTIQLSTLDFEGLLTVIQVDEFLNLLRYGIGSAKGFGCGMMLVRKV